jgi:ABC-type uncharacterized transport system auxiliary subunit
VAPRAQVRLDRVTAAASLRYAIVRRDSDVEITPYDSLRWTELPDVFVRRALARALFDERPLAQVFSGDAPSLDVEVRAFEEVVRGTHHAGRVTLHYELRGEHDIIARGTLTAERPARSPAIESVVVAIRQAMVAATAELAARVESALLERAPPAPEAPYARDPHGDSSASARAPALH